MSETSELAAYMYLSNSFGLFIVINKLIDQLILENCKLETCIQKKLSFTVFFNQSKDSEYLHIASSPDITKTGIIS